jgi:hypothetical protein
MSATAEVQIPDIASLTPEQRWRLLNALIIDEMKRTPIPMAFVVRDGDRIVGEFRPLYTPPAKTTLPPVPEGYWEKVAKLADDRSDWISLAELRVLEDAEADGELLR